MTEIPVPIQRPETQQVHLDALYPDQIGELLEVPVPDWAGLRQIEGAVAPRQDIASSYQVIQNLVGNSMNGQGALLSATYSGIIKGTRHATGSHVTIVANNHFPHAAEASLLTQYYPNPTDFINAMGQEAARRFMTMGQDITQVPEGAQFVQQLNSLAQAIYGERLCKLKELLQENQNAAQNPEPERPRSPEELEEDREILEHSGGFRRHVNRLGVWAAQFAARGRNMLETPARLVRTSQATRAERRYTAQLQQTIQDPSEDGYSTPSNTAALHQLAQLERTRDQATARVERTDRIRRERVERAGRPNMSREAEAQRQAVIRLAEASTARRELRRELRARDVPRGERESVIDSIPADTRQEFGRSAILAASSRQHEGQASGVLDDTLDNHRAATHEVSSRHETRSSVADTIRTTRQNIRRAHAQVDMLSSTAEILMAERDNLSSESPTYSTDYADFTRRIHAMRLSEEQHARNIDEWERDITRYQRHLARVHSRLNRARDRRAETEDRLESSSAALADASGRRAAREQRRQERLNDVDEYLRSQN